jgi:hypothetical protein
VIIPSGWHLFSPVEIFETSASLGLIIHFDQQRLFGALASHH